MRNVIFLKLGRSQYIVGWQNETEHIVCRINKRIGAAAVRSIFQMCSVNTQPLSGIAVTVMALFFYPLVGLTGTVPPLKVSTVTL
jgi:hypothetical protein